jgi:hypothetical protein
MPTGAKTRLFAGSVGLTETRPSTAWWGTALLGRPKMKSIEYGSSKERRLSSAGSPVEEIIALSFTV